MRSIRLFGTGTGIWGDERQITVPKERVREALEALRRAGFGSLPESYGEEEEEEGASWRVEMICRVRLALDGVEKQSYQLSAGEQSAALKALAEEILAIGEELGPSGVAATSLEDGLDKIARGELTPETLTVQLQHQPDDPKVLEGGWILRIEDGRVQVSHQSPESGWTDPRRVRFSRDEIAALARTLAAARPEDLPVNLYSDWYDDLEIRVLNQKKSLQARRFANMTPETHGEKQQRFAQIVAALAEVEGRVGG